MKIDKDKIKEIVEFLHKDSNHKYLYVANICDTEEELAAIVVEAYQWCDYHKRRTIDALTNAHKNEIAVLKQQIADLSQFKLDTAEKFIYGNVSRKGMF